MMKVLFFALVAMTTTASTVERRLIGGNSNCPTQQVRVRKAWEMMTESEQELYRQALQISIEKGIFQYFVTVHMDAVSEMVAHDTCGFVLWHRRYLLAYENMLRNMVDEDGNYAFACVTLPYMNTMDQFQHQADGECDNLQDCCPIVTGLGGVPSNDDNTRTYNGRTVTNKCYSGSPYENYCDDNEECGCVVRNDVSKTPVPSGSSYVSLFRLIAESKSYSVFTTGVQRGVHNEIHAAMGGVMATFASPADALFFSWHGTVDMLMFIWHNCHVARPMRGAELYSSEYAFNQEEECRLQKRAVDTLDSMSAETAIYMHSNGSDIRDHPIIGVYFRDVGTAYGSFADTRSMGDYSYAYRVPDGFYRMLTDRSQCESAGLINWPRPRDGAGEDGSDDGSLTYWEWYDQTRARLLIKYGNDTLVVNQQLEFLECMGFNEKFGVQEFDEEFIEDFLEGSQMESRCKAIIDSINNGTTTVDPEEDNTWGEKAEGTKGNNDNTVGEKDGKSSSGASQLSAVTALFTIFFFALFTNNN